MVIVILRESDLVRLRACDDGMRLYRELLALQGGTRVVCRRPDDSRVIRHRTDRVKLRLCLLAMLWLARDCEFVGWLRDQGLIPPVFAPRANLYGANLSRANLSRANLSRANLDGANLDGANLDGANIDGANLDGASLYGASLEGANLSRASLSRANLYGANLYGANLYGANLYGANLYGANLDGANLDGANLDGAWRLPSDAVPEGWVCKDDRLSKAVP